MCAYGSSASHVQSDIWVSAILGRLDLSAHLAATRATCTSALVQMCLPPQVSPERTKQLFGHRVEATATTTATTMTSAKRLKSLLERAHSSRAHANALRLIDLCIIVVMRPKIKRASIRLYHLFIDRLSFSSAWCAYEWAGADAISEHVGLEFKCQMPAERAPLLLRRVVGASIVRARQIGLANYLFGRAFVASSSSRSPSLAGWPQSQVLFQLH